LVSEDNLRYSIFLQVSMVVNEVDNYSSDGKYIGIKAGFEKTLMALTEMP
jgi:hypothetical protein